MHDAIAKMLNSQEGLLTLAIIVIVGVNVSLTGLKKFLGWLKGKTESKADDNAYNVVVKVLGWLDKALEFASANSHALPAKAKAELDKGEWKEVPASEALKEKE